MCIWKEVVGFNNYQVSDTGLVRSNKYGDWRVLKPGLCGRDAVYQSLVLRQDGKPSNRYVHHLVLEAFVGARPEGMHCLHGANGKSDNSLANLYYGTPSQNHGIDKIRDGTDNRGGKHGNSVLKPEQVIEIKSRLKNGERGKDIAEDYNVGPVAICDIKNGRNWAWLCLQFTN
jgi:hypothetical protein